MNFEPGPIWKEIIIFIKNWKEIEPWLILFWIAHWLFLILTIFRGWIRVKVGPKKHILGTSCFCKNSSFWKCFKWHLCNYKDYPWSTFQLNLMLFTGVIAPKFPKMDPIGSRTKKCSCLFWVKLRTANTQKPKLGIQKV